MGIPERMYVEGWGSQELAAQGGVVQTYSPMNIARINHVWSTSGWEGTG